MHARAQIADLPGELLSDHALPSPASTAVHGTLHFLRDDRFLDSHVEEVTRQLHYLLLFLLGHARLLDMRRAVGVVVEILVGRPTGAALKSAVVFLNVPQSES